MRGTFPIICCDAEEGCDQWTLDWYTATADNWRDLMAPGWFYEPYTTGDEAYCPEHTDNPETEAPAEQSRRTKETER